MNKEKDSFIFYRSFYEALKTISSSDRAILYEAIAEYAFDQNTIQLPANCKGLFLLIKPQLDANHKRFVDGSKGGKHGKKGGRPTKNTPMDNNQETPLGLFPETPNKNVNANVNVNKNEDKGIRLKDFFNSLEEMKDKNHVDSIPDDFTDEWVKKHRDQSDRMWNEWEKFVNYFASPDCKKPVKKDWLGAWRNWITK